MKVRRAFTLVELLVVMSVIILLIGILSPSLIAGKEIARVGQCSSNVGNLLRNVVMYTNANSGLLPPYKLRYDPATGKPSGNDPNTGKLFAPQDPCCTTIAFGTGGVPVDDPETGLLNDPYNLGFVYRENFINDYRMLYCPSQPNAENTVGHYPRPWSKGPNEVLDGYMYNPNVDANASPVPYRFQPKVDIFPTDCPLVCDLVYGADFVSHTVGADWRWNVGRINGNVTTVGSREIQRYLVSDPNGKDFKEDWDLLNTKVYVAILMK